MSAAGGAWVLMGVAIVLLALQTATESHRRLSSFYCDRAEMTG